MNQINGCKPCGTSIDMDGEYNNHIINICIVSTLNIIIRKLIYGLLQYVDFYKVDVILFGTICTF